MAWSRQTQREEVAHAILTEDCIYRSDIIRSYNDGLPASEWPLSYQRLDTLLEEIRRMAVMGKIDYTIAYQPFEGRKKLWVVLRASGGDPLTQKQFESVVGGLRRAGIQARAWTRHARREIEIAERHGTLIPPAREKLIRGDSYLRDMIYSAERFIAEMEAPVIGMNGP